MLEIYGIRSRTAQPLHSVGLSQRHPSNIGWLRFWNFADSSGGNGPRELTGARRDSWTFRANAKRAANNSNGAGLYTGGGAYNDGGAYCDDSYRTSITSKLTAILLCTPTSSTNSEFWFGNTSLISGGDYNWGIYRSHSSAIWAAFVKNTSGTAQSVAAGAATLGKPSLVGLTYDGATIRLYVNGVMTGSVAQTGNVQTSDLSTTFCDWYGASQSQAGYILYAGIANRVWSPAEFSDLAANPWSLFEEEEEPVFISLSSAVSLVVDDLTHAHAVDALALTQDHQLAVGDSTHAHPMDALALTQQHQLAVADATHAHPIDALDLTQLHQLVVQDATHAHPVDALTLTQTHLLALAHCLHAHAIDHVDLSGVVSLAIADCLHGHLADGVTLGTSTTLVIADVLHSHAADAIALGQVHVLVVNDIVHAQLVDSLALSLPGAVLAGERALVVPAENRALIIVAESRALAIAAEIRALTVH